MVYEIINTQTLKVVNRIFYDGSKGSWTAPVNCVMQEDTGLNVGADVELDGDTYVLAIP